jgi:hypothetical protein
MNAPCCGVLTPADSNHSSGRRGPSVLIVIVAFRPEANAPNYNLQPSVAETDFCPAPKANFALLRLGAVYLAPQLFKAVRVRRHQEA